MVEILRPAQRHSASLESEVIEAPRPGAPFAPFLAQFLAQEQSNERSMADVADRYEAAAALADEPSRICVATV
ncbi:MAG: hypothetical protein GC190_13820 [Alphaproteobacteria bacterium]|nr:hypothetical protein [Alphaproteobacteria bacterium]